MNPHTAGCYGWAGTRLVARCDHPRPWRIRKTGHRWDRWPWLVYRLDNEGHYVLFVRAETFGKALNLVNCMISIAEQGDP